MKYILYSRPYSIGTCPSNGLVKATLPSSKEERHGILEYDRELTIEEIRHFELVPIWDSLLHFVTYLFTANFFNDSRIRFIESMIEYATEPDNDIEDIYEGIGQDVKPGGTWLVRGQFSANEIGKYLFENLQNQINLT